jgi:hypothetical protein
LIFVVENVRGYMKNRKIYEAIVNDIVFILGERAEEFQDKGEINRCLDFIEDNWSLLRIYYIKSGEIFWSYAMAPLMDGIVSSEVNFYRVVRLMEKETSVVGLKKLNPVDNFLTKMIKINGFREFDLITRYCKEKGISKRFLLSFISVIGTLAYSQSSNIELYFYEKMPVFLGNIPAKDYMEIFKKVTDKLGEGAINVWASDFLIKLCAYLYNNSKQNNRRRMLTIARNTSYSFSQSFYELVDFVEEV